MYILNSIQHHSHHTYQLIKWYFVICFAEKPTPTPPKRGLLNITNNLKSPLGRGLRGGLKDNK